MSFAADFEASSNASLGVARAVNQFIVSSGEAQIEANLLLAAMADAMDVDSTVMRAKNARLEADVEVARGRLAKQEWITGTRERMADNHLAAARSARGPALERTIGSDGSKLPPDFKFHDARDRFMDGERIRAVRGQQALKHKEKEQGRFIDANWDAHGPSRVARAELYKKAAEEATK